MRNFAAIDFETANFERCSVCSVGVVIVRNGEIDDTFYSLIHPEPNYFNRICTNVHGLTRQDTEDAPVFNEVWTQVEPLVAGLPLVAHNSSFDEGCFVPLSEHTKWTTLTIFSSIPLKPPGMFFPISLIISSILLRRHVAIILLTITML